MPRMDKLSSYKTTISADATAQIIVTYHKTQIVRVEKPPSIYAGQIRLDFGGWDTVTTRRKMNQAARQFNLGYAVERRKGETFIRYHANHALAMWDKTQPSAEYQGGPIWIDPTAGTINAFVG